jgi:hypothetical protein
LPVGDFNEAGVTAQTSIFVPRHQLAGELGRVIEEAFRDRGAPITVPILRGRENGGDEGNAPCRRWREARELARKGLPIYTNLCQRKSDRQSAQCPYFTGCEYIQTRQAAYSSPFVILVHSHLGLEWGATAAERFNAEEDEDGGGERQRHFNPKQANIIICDEDPTASLVEQMKVSPDGVRGIDADGLGEKILEGLIHPRGLLTYLRDQGVSPDQLTEAAEGERTTERNRGQIASPAAGDGDVAQAAQSPCGWSGSRGYWSGWPRNWHPGVRDRLTRCWRMETGCLRRGAGLGSSMISGFSCWMELPTRRYCGSSYLSCRTCRKSACNGTRGSYR